jgi:hypothetical protein
MELPIFKSPGVFVKEEDIDIVYPRFSKRYSRRIKIGKIFDIDVPSVIVTSTPKGGPQNSPQYINSSNFSEFF